MMIQYSIELHDKVYNQHLVVVSNEQQLEVFTSQIAEVSNAEVAPPSGRLMRREAGTWNMAVLVIES